MVNSKSIHNQHENSELKPCPFCGGQVIHTTFDYHMKEIRICCEECIAEMRFSFVDAGIDNCSIVDFEKLQKIIQELYDLWNRRTPNEKNDFKE